METPRESDDVFKIDEEYSDSGSGKSPASEDRDSRPEKPALDLMPAPSTGANEEIELSRRAVPVVELDADVCSICLDEFTSEDPEQHTACEHRYHLQCIMQWAQRSRECPMCFKALQLKDDALNELLPFGEYVAPERMAASAPQFVMGLDAWELEQLLQRLAAVNGPGAASSRRDRRRHRSHAHHPCSSSSGRHSGETNGGVHDSGHVKMNGRMIHEPASSSRVEGENSSSGTVMPEEAALHPSSWPPPSQRNLMSHAEARMPHTAEKHQGGVADGLQGLRSRLAGIKDSFLKGRWSGQHRASQEHARPSSSGAAPPPAQRAQQQPPST